MNTVFFTVKRIMNRGTVKMCIITSLYILFNQHIINRVADLQVILSADSVKIQQAHRLIFLRTLLSGEVFRLHVLQLFVEIALRVKKPTSRSANTDVTDLYALLCKTDRVSNLFLEKNSSIFFLVFHQ